MIDASSKYFNRKKIIKLAISCYPEIRLLPTIFFESLSPHLLEKSVEKYKTGLYSLHVFLGENLISQYVFQRNSFFENKRILDKNYRHVFAKSRFLPYRKTLNMSAGHFTKINNYD